MNCRTNTDSRKRKKSKHPTPPTPKSIQDMLKFRDHDGLTFKVCECADFWTPVVSTIPHLQDREAPGRVGWIQKGKQGDY